VLVVVAGGVLAGWYALAGRNTHRPDLLLHTVKKEKLQVTIVERGALESAENNEITCTLKARTQGSTVASTIRWVIDDGSFVKKGDKLIDLDDSGLQDQLITQQIVMETAKGNWQKAEEDYKITISQNESDIATQELAIKVNTLTYKEYVEGTYDQTKVDLEGKLTMARSDLAMWQERAAWSERMSRPGRVYVTVAQAEADHARLLSADITLKGLEQQLDVLNRLTQIKQKEDLQGKTDEATRALDRVTKQAKAKLIQADVTRQTMKLTYDKEKARYEDIGSEIKKCTITAPDAGIVVYYAEDRNRFSQGRQSFIAQGESVLEGQKLMRIPNLYKMLVNSRVHEAMVSRVHGDQGAGRKGSVRGQRATVRVNAFADHLLHGHVKSVATVPSQQDFFASDVKVYQTMIAIDDTMEGLKPGMDAEVTIYVDTNDHPVLAIPLQAVLGSVSMGEKRRCFVATPNGPQTREVTLGLANETMVEVKDGLEEAEEVILNPLVLLSEKEKREFANQPVRRRRGGGQGPGGQGKGDRQQGDTQPAGGVQAGPAPGGSGGGQLKGGSGGGRSKGGPGAGGS
jgi:HlyD family secretion protein